MTGIESTEENARIFSSLSLRGLSASKDMFVVLTAFAAHGGSLTNDRYAWTVGFWNFFTRQILEIPTDRPTKVCENLSDFWKSLHVQVELYFSGIFERQSLVSFVEQRDNFSQKPCERSGSWREMARIFSSLIGLPASAEKDMFVVLTAYVGSLANNRYVDDWILKLVLPDRYSKYRQTDPRNSATKTVRF